MDGENGDPRVGCEYMRAPQPAPVEQNGSTGQFMLAGQAPRIHWVSSSSAMAASHSSRAVFNSESPNMG